MSVRLIKFTCTLLLILPSVVYAQLDLLPLPGSTRQVTQLFESPVGNPTPANSPNLQPTPSSTPAPGFGQVLQLPGTDLLNNGAARGQQAFQAPGDSLPFESPLVGNGLQPTLNAPAVTNSRCGPGGCPKGNCSNNRGAAGPQIYSGLDPNSSVVNNNPTLSLNAPLAGAASVFSGGIVQGSGGGCANGQCGRQSLAANGSNILVPPVPTGSPLPCGGGECSSGTCSTGTCSTGTCGGGEISAPISNSWAPDASYGGGDPYGGGGCSDGSCSVGDYVGESCGAGGCGLFQNLLSGGRWGGGGLGGLGGGGGCGPCAKQRFYGSVQYLYWYTRGQRTPALATSAVPGTPISRAAVLAQPTTQTLLGGGRLDSNGFSGGLLNLGMNLGPNNAFEFNFFSLGDEESLFDQTASGDQILARPFFNTFTNQQDAEFVSFPGLVEGRLRVSSDLDFRGFGARWRHNLLCGCPCFCRSGGPCGSCNGGFSGGGLGYGGLGGGGLGGCGRGFGSFLHNLCNGGGFRSIGGFTSGLSITAFDSLIGYRHFDLDEQLRIEENLVSTSTTNGVPVGTTIDIVDEFRTTNDFDGVDLGLNWEWGGASRWGLGLQTSVAFGNNRQRAFIDGSTVITTPNEAPVTNVGGLLALESNIGTFERDQFTVVPQVGANLYYTLFPGARLSFGYSLVYFDDVLRPGSIIDNNVDPRLLPPAVVGAGNQPNFIAQSDNFWAQGINFGIDFCF